MRRAGVRSIINILGCTIGGARHSGVDIAGRTPQRMTGKEAATLFRLGCRTDALHAALNNCLASSIDGFDGTHAQAVVHPGGSVFPAALVLHGIVCTAPMPAQGGFTSPPPPPEGGRYGFLSVAGPGR